MEKIIQPKFKAGVVDRDYTGNVGVVLVNTSDTPYIINKGDRIAQLICEKIENPILEEINEIPETSRSGNGFGSTGI